MTAISTSDATSAPASTMAPRLLAKQEVSALLGVSDRTLEKLVKARKFPPPVRLGKTARWVESIVVSWLHQKVAAQLAWKPRKQSLG